MRVVMFRHQAIKSPVPAAEFFRTVDGCFASRP
jgi:hypothetical protein